MGFLLAFYFSRVLIGFNPNSKIIESKVGKTPNGTRKTWNPPFEVGFMVKLQSKGVWVRTNPNKFLYLVCVWVMTHIRVVFERKS